jgi:hypothetical protein
MQVIIDQVVSEIRAFDSELSPATLERVVRAVLEGLGARDLERERLAEETSLQNHQQRNPAGER